MISIHWDKCSAPIRSGLRSLAWWLALTFVFSAFVVAAPSHTWGQPALLRGWFLSEFQPDIPNGGRANTIAVHPANDNVLFVTSESGGLFRSSDGGSTWQHVDGLPQFLTNAVTFVPSNPNIVLVTTSEDTAKTNDGGIWRSADGGTTWTHIPNPPPPFGVTDRFSAYELAVAPDTGHIYVGTSYGIAISSDDGATWTQSNPFGGGSFLLRNRRVMSVVAQKGNRVLAAGPSGLRRSSDSGATWLVPTTSPGGIVDLHALGRSPIAQDHAYAVNGNTELYYTEDWGDHWTKISSAPRGDDGCGGIAFVKIIPRMVIRTNPLVRRLAPTLYFSNRCGLSRLNASLLSGFNRFDYNGAWVTLNDDHGDTRDLVFANGNRPLLLATDGGLHKTANGGLNWTFINGGRNGFNALQITEVRGQWVDDVPRHDLYFGTQDNSLYSSGNTGATWTVACCEGFFIEAEYHVKTARDSQITFVACAECSNFRSGALFSGIADWQNPAGALDSNPKIIGKSFHVQGSEAAGGFSKGLAVSIDLGATWEQYATFGEDRRDLPKLGWLRQNVLIAPRVPILYQSIRTGWDPELNFEINHLARITKNLSSNTASVRYPAMNNFGGLGINPTMFAWYQVFAVDPRNPNHLIAPDVVNQAMMQTFDGGDTWSEIPQLTDQVTGNGRFLFRRGIFPQVSAISFYPDDPNMVALGTWQNGIFLSTDRGATWTKVPQSERVPYITSFDWRTAHDLVVSSYGRGLWRLNFSMILDLHLLAHYCEFCNTRPLLPRIRPLPPRPDPPPEPDGAVLVFGGRIQGARVADGRVRELFIRPGSSVAFLSRQETAPDIKLTEITRQVGFSGLRGVPKAPDRADIIVGITMRAGALAGLIFSRSPLEMNVEERKAELAAEKAEPGEHAVGRAESPIAGKPYVEVITGHVTGANSAIPGQTIQIAGRSHRAGSTVEIAIDGKVIEKAAVAADGRFSATVEAPRQFGMHNITIIDQESAKPVDGAMLLVRPEDKDEGREERKRKLRKH